jgi:hypothetical protein
VREGKGGGAIAGDQALEPLVARHLEQHRGEHRVVLDDEDHMIAVDDGVTVVGRGRQSHRRRGGAERGTGIVACHRRGTAAGGLRRRQRFHRQE